MIKLVKRIYSIYFSCLLILNISISSTLDIGDINFDNRESNTPAINTLYGKGSGIASRCA